MLIHLQGKVENDYILFDLPQIYFNRGQSVAVAYIEIEWNRAQSIKIHGEITSSLVDKSPCNPKQQIYRIYKYDGSDYTVHTPTHFFEYKLQCLDLKSSVFKINVYDKDENKIPNFVKGVYLTLIISDARVQSGPPGKTY